MAGQVARIVSGGQSGVDRAALDWGLTHDVPCGGWCPAGGWAEDLTEPPGLLARYPTLRATPSPDPAERTRWNVRDSDLTLVITAAPSPGTDLTIDVARQLGRPCVVTDGGEGVVPAFRDALTSLGATDGATLNVAGPRASEWATGYETTSRALDLLAAHGLVTIGHHRRRGRRWGSCGRCRWPRSGSWAR